MGIFSKEKDGGISDVIRCDEKEYLIWKWHPANSDIDSKRANAIRWGSSLRVREGSLAVFVYKTSEGNMQDFIEGPCDKFIETTNFPVLSTLIGKLYDGVSPFQAEIYFINLARTIQFKFGVPYFDVFDPRFADYSVPVSVRGTMTFSIGDYRQFIKFHRLDSFNIEDLKKQLKDAISREVKQSVSNAPFDYNIPAIQLERVISNVSSDVKTKMTVLANDAFGVNISDFAVEVIDIDRNSESYIALKQVTQDIAQRTTLAEADATVKNIRDTQVINAENMKETLRVQREEAQYAQHLKTRNDNIAAYQIEQQTKVGVEGAQALGKMGSSTGVAIGGGEGGTSLNPAAMMAGISIGGAVGQNVAGIINGSLNQNNVQMSNQGVTPPPLPKTDYFVVVNGNQMGPIDKSLLVQMFNANQIDSTTLAWTQGMPEWKPLSDVIDLTDQSSAVVPPPLPST